MLDTILFDLDGTLLPMDQNDFIKAYVTQLCRRYVPCGYDKDAIIKALWTGTAAMVKNDGTCTNEDRFWAAFDALLGDTAPIRDSIPSFYTTEFDAVKEIAAPVAPGPRNRGHPARQGLRPDPGHEPPLPRRGGAHPSFLDRPCAGGLLPGHDLR